MTLLGEVDSNALRDTLAYTAPATSREETRPGLTCVQFRSGDGSLTLTATDAYRLVTHKLEAVAFEGTEALISRKDCMLVVKELKKHKGQQMVGIRTRDDRVEFRWEDGSETCVAKVDALFPNTASIWPSANRVDLILTFQAEELRAACSFPAKLTRHRKNGEDLCPVTIEHLGGNDAVIWYSRAYPEEIEGGMHVDCLKLAEHDYRLTFNPRYLLDGLQGWKRETVTLRCAGPTTAAILGEGCLIMPVQVDYQRNNKTWQEVMGNVS